MKPSFRSTSDMIYRAHNKTFIKVFALGSIILILISGGIFYTIYNLALSEVEGQLVTNEGLMAELHHQIIFSAIEHTTNALIYFSDLPALSEFIDDPSQVNQDRLEATIKNFPVQAFAFDQVRLLNTAGMEILRVNNNGTTGEVVPNDQLQDKSQRYYFKELRETDTDKIYFSILDLNVEHGEIELPYKPTIRIGMDVHSANGEVAGYLLINIDMNKVIDGFVLDEQTDAIIGGILLTDQNGYYIFNEPQPFKSFGSILSDRELYNFQEDEPEVWAAIQTQVDGYFRTDDNLFTFRTVDLSQNTLNRTNEDVQYSINSSNNKYHLILDLTPSKIKVLEKRLIILRNVFLVVFLFILPVITYVSSLLVSILNENRLAYLHQAEHDPLTGVGNRKLLFSRFDVDSKKGNKSSEFTSVFYFDLDGFKQVNDAFGHKAGDLILEAVTNKVNSVLRKSDILARVGGDEFAIVTVDPMDKTSASTLAKRVVDVIRQPVHWDDKELIVSASVGIYLCTEVKIDLDQAILRADRAMLNCKKNGKDNFEFSDEC